MFLDSMHKAQRARFLQKKLSRRRILKEQNVIVIGDLSPFYDILLAFDHHRASL